MMYACVCLDLDFNKILNKMYTYRYVRYAYVAGVNKSYFWDVF